MSAPSPQEPVGRKRPPRRTRAEEPRDQTQTIRWHAEPTDDGRFLRRRAFRRLIAGLLMLVALHVWGVLGYVAMGWKPFDALYMVAITVSTVGFGEVRPLNTPLLRLHTMLIIGMGTITVTFLVGTFIQIIAEGEIQRLLGHQQLRRRLVNLSQHTIIVGFGRMGSLLCEELAEVGQPFVVIEQDPVNVAELQRRGYLFVQGDATEEAVLAEAGIERARALVTAVSSDADALFITLTARQMAPTLRIVSRAELPSSQKKLIQAGANHVVLTAAIGARRIAALLTNPNAVEFVELVTKQSHLDLEIDELPIDPGHPFVGQSLRDADIGRRTGVIVIAIKQASGRVVFPPSSDHQLAAGEGLIVLGRRPNLVQLREVVQKSPEAS